MALLEKLQKDMVEAMKAKESARLDAIRMIKSALQKFQIDAMKPLDEPSELQVLNTLLKQRKEAVEMYKTAGRPELAEKEEVELKMIEAYMPASATAEDIDAAIMAAIAENPGATLKQMGVVMKAAQAKLTGKRVDGKAMSDAVRAKLT
jgi:uncharacterized protein